MGTSSIYASAADRAAQQSHTRTYTLLLISILSVFHRLLISTTYLYLCMRTFMYVLTVIFGHLRLELAIFAALFTYQNIHV